MLMILGGVGLAAYVFSRNPTSKGSLYATEVNLEDIAIGESRQFSILIHNPLPRDVEIEYIRVNCGCIADITKQPIVQRHGISELKGVFHAHDFSRDELVEKAVIVKFKGGIAPLIVPITANIRQAILIPTHDCEFSEIERAVRIDVNRKFLSQRKFANVAMSPVPGFTWQVKSRTNDHLVIEGKVQSLHEFIYPRQLTVHVENECGYIEKHVVVIRRKAESVPFTILPTSYFAILDRGKSHETSPQKFRIRSKLEGTTWTITKVASAADKCDFMYDICENGEFVNIWFAADTRQIENITGILTFSASNGLRQENINVPYYLFFK